jgi:nucleosome binding factor SPN SPT16 subunit
LTADQKRRIHQRDLATELQAQGLARYGTGSGAEDDDREIQIKKFESYKKDASLPKEVKNMRVTSSPC